MMLEITKLHYLLEDAKIPHTFEGLEDGGFQIRVYADAEMTDELDDCIFRRFSHGYDEGLLETFNLGGCDGYETAEQVFEGWMKMYKKSVDNA